MKFSSALAVLVLVLIAILSAVSSTGTAPAAAAGAAPDGKAIFLAQKCNMCHSIEAQGIARTSKSEKTKGPDLGGLSKRHNADWTKKWLNKEEQLNGKKHLMAFKGTPQELDALVAWLQTQ